jgi:hypothetical protein
MAEMSGKEVQGWGRGVREMGGVVETSGARSSREPAVNFRGFGIIHVFHYREGSVCTYVP